MVEVEALFVSKRLVVVIKSHKLVIHRQLWPVELALGRPRLSRSNSAQLSTYGQRVVYLCPLAAFGHIVGSSIIAFFRLLSFSSC